VDFIGLPDHFDVIASRPRFRVAPPSGEKRDRLRASEEAAAGMDSVLRRVRVRVRCRRRGGGEERQRGESQSARGGGDGCQRLYSQAEGQMHPPMGILPYAYAYGWALCRGILRKLCGSVKLGIVMAYFGLGEL